MKVKGSLSPLASVNQFSSDPDIYRDHRTLHSFMRTNYYSHCKQLLID